MGTAVVGATVVVAVAVGATVVVGAMVVGSIVVVGGGAVVGATVLVEGTEVGGGRAVVVGAGWVVVLVAPVGTVVSVVADVEDKLHPQPAASVTSKPVPTRSRVFAGKLDIRQ